jgi:hypothetical protein
MFDKEPRITIDGVDGVWILMNNDGEDGENGAIATKEMFYKFAESYAHMFDGVINRYGKVIAKKGQWHYVIDEKDNN